VSPEARRRLIALLRSAGACYGPRWGRVLRIVDRPLEGDEVDRELGRLLFAPGWEGYDNVVAMLDEEGEFGLRLSALDLVTEIAQRR
jgi:hypothetical protein